MGLLGSILRNNEDFLNGNVMQTHIKLYTTRKQV